MKGDGRARQSPKAGPNKVAVTGETARTAEKADRGAVRTKEPCKKSMDSIKKWQVWQRMGSLAVVGPHLKVRSEWLGEAQGESQDDASQGPILGQW